MDPVTVVAQKLRRKAKQKHARLTELGNAERLAAKFADELRYVRAKKQWFGYDGRRWRVDDVGIVDAAAKSIVADLYAEAGEKMNRAAEDLERANDGDSTESNAGKVGKALLDHANRSSKASSIAAMIRLASTEPPLVATPEAFDRDPLLINVENGTVDLRDGSLRPHRREDMITKIAAVAYDKKATCEGFLAFLAEVLPIADVRIWLQKFLGYCLTGQTVEQVLAFLIGLGANGKSVLIDVVLAILGDYGLRAAPDLVLASHNDRHPTEIADLEGARLAVCSEIEQGRTWAESTIKRITGDTTIKARKMGMNFYEFTATHKIIVAANTRPTVRGTDYAIWRRMRLVPFDVTIPPDKRDKHLVEKLLGERAGIFAWLVEGALLWQREGLGEPHVMTEAARVYRESQDVLGMWIEDECVQLSSLWTPGERLHTSYSDWCKRAGHEPWTRRAFTDRLTERPGISADRRHGGRGIAGIGLRADGGA